MTPGLPIGLVIAALGGLVNPRFGFAMLALIVLGDMITARYFGLDK